MSRATVIEGDTEVTEKHPWKWLVTTMLLSTVTLEFKNVTFNGIDESGRIIQQIQTEWFKGLTTDQIDELGRASARVRMLGTNTEDQTTLSKYDAMQKEFRAYHPQQELQSLLLQKSFFAGILGILSGAGAFFSGYKLWKNT